MTSDPSVFPLRQQTDDKPHQRRKHEAQEKRPLLPDAPLLADFFGYDQGQDVPGGEQDAEPDCGHSFWFQVPGFGFLIKIDYQEYYGNNDPEHRQPGTAPRNALGSPHQEQPRDRQDDQRAGKNVGDPRPALLRIVMQVIHLPEKRPARDFLQQPVAGFGVDYHRPAFEKDLELVALREIMILVAPPLPDLIHQAANLVLRDPFLYPRRVIERDLLPDNDVIGIPF